MPTVIAHRGASAEAPEHTLDAYDRALAAGADWLELDVRALADGTLVVVHDRTLARTCGDPRAVADLLPRDLLALDPATRPLTLAHVFARYGTDARYLVELKDPEPADGPRALAVADVLGVRRQVALQSFAHRPLRRLRGEGVPLYPLYPPRVPSRWLRMDLPRIGDWAAGLAPHAGSVDGALVVAAHDRGIEVRAYTVNDPAEMERLVAAGVDGLITDLPGLAVAVTADVALAA